jgi:hypothetical protein
MEVSERTTLHTLKKLGERLEQLYALEFREHVVRLKARIDNARISGTWKNSNNNLFRILGCDRNEEVHSNILAWLLDPEESHGLGTQFLSTFMAWVFQKQVSIRMPIEVTKNRQTAGDRPDIVIRGYDWLMVLENKVDAAEGETQTLRYSERWKRLAAIQKRDPFFAFVSPHGSSAKASEFVPVSYGMIREMIQNLYAVEHPNVLFAHLIDHIRDDLEDT